MNYLYLFQVKVPKFKVETTASLVGALAKLGMTSAFGSGANFSGISDEPLEISNVIHKAFIEVTFDNTQQKTY